MSTTITYFFRIERCIDPCFQITNVTKIRDKQKTCNANDPMPFGHIDNATLGFTIRFLMTAMANGRW